ncbi:hypothetical protein AGIG_G118 [Arapaima gigas]
MENARSDDGGSDYVSRVAALRGNEARGEPGGRNFRLRFRELKRLRVTAGWSRGRSRARGTGPVMLKGGEGPAPRDQHDRVVRPGCRRQRNV